MAASTTTTVEPNHDYHPFHDHDEHLKALHIRQFNAPFEVVPMIIENAIHKTKYTWDQLLILGIVSGIYVAFGGVLSLMVSNGIPSIKASDPGIPKLVTGVLFPVALIFIIMCGGELFTGNTMFFMVALLDRKVKVKELARNWSIVYIANFIGAVGGAYLFGYLTEVFEKDPWLSGVQSIIITKTEKNFGVVFLKGIAANELVNLAIILTLVSEDIISKMAGAWFAILAFAVIGYEHCVANMFMCTISLMYGGQSDFWTFLWKNLIPTTLGNIIGGSFMVGGLYYYSYMWRGQHLRKPRHPHDVVLASHPSSTDSHGSHSIELPYASHPHVEPAHK